MRLNDQQIFADTCVDMLLRRFDYRITIPCQISCDSVTLFFSPRKCYVGLSGNFRESVGVHFYVFFAPTQCILVNDGMETTMCRILSQCVLIGLRFLGWEMFTQMVIPRSGLWRGRFWVFLGLFLGFGVNCYQCNTNY